MAFVIKSVRVTRDNAPVIVDASMTVAPGELHVLCGQNGSGKTTLLSALMGHPNYTVCGGSVVLDGDDMTGLPTHERARKGLLLALQQPPEVMGVPVGDFLRTAIAAKEGSQPKTADFARRLSDALAQLRLDPHFAERHVNVGFSGGEKKRAEMLHMLMLAPKYALLDEPDSGLDADAVEYVASALDALRAQGTGLLMVTHSAQFLARLRPDAIWTLQSGKLTRDVGSGMLDPL